MDDLVPRVRVESKEEKAPPRPTEDTNGNEKGNQTPKNETIQINEADSHANTIKQTPPASSVDLPSPILSSTHHHFPIHSGNSRPSTSQQEAPLSAPSFAASPIGLSPALTKETAADDQLSQPSSADNESPKPVAAAEAHPPATADSQASSVDDTLLSTTIVQPLSSRTRTRRSSKSTASSSSKLKSRSNSLSSSSSATDVAPSASSSSHASDAHSHRCSSTSCGSHAAHRALESRSHFDELRGHELAMASTAPDDKVELQRLIALAEREALIKTKEYQASLRERLYRLEKEQQEWREEKKREKEQAELEQVKQFKREPYKPITPSAQTSAASSFSSFSSSSSHPIPPLDVNSQAYSNWYWSVGPGSQLDHPSPNKYYRAIKGGWKERLQARQEKEREEREKEKQRTKSRTHSTDSSHVAEEKQTSDASQLLDGNVTPLGGSMTSAASDASLRPSSTSSSQSRSRSRPSSSSASTSSTFRSRPVTHATRDYTTSLYYRSLLEQEDHYHRMEEIARTQYAFKPTLNPASIELAKKARERSASRESAARTRIEHEANDAHHRSAKRTPKRDASRTHEQRTRSSSNSNRERGSVRDRSSSPGVTSDAPASPHANTNTDVLTRLYPSSTQPLSPSASSKLARMSRHSAESTKELTFHPRVSTNRTRQEFERTTKGFRYQFQTPISMGEYFGYKDGTKQSPSSVDGTNQPMSDSSDHPTEPNMNRDTNPAVESSPSIQVLLTPIPSSESQPTHQHSHSFPNVDNPIDATPSVMLSSFSSAPSSSSTPNLHASLNHSSHSITSHDTVASAPSTFARSAQQSQMAESAPVRSRQSSQSPPKPAWIRSSSLSPSPSSSVRSAASSPVSPSVSNPFDHLALSSIPAHRLGLAFAQHTPSSSASSSPTHIRARSMTPNGMRDAVAGGASSLTSRDSGRLNFAMIPSRARVGTGASATDLMSIVDSTTASRPVPLTRVTRASSISPGGRSSPIATPTTFARLDLTTRFMTWAEHRQERLAEIKRQTLERQLQECTFQPKLETNISTQRQRGRGRSTTRTRSVTRDIKSVDASHHQQQPHHPTSVSTLSHAHSQSALCTAEQSAVSLHTSRQARARQQRSEEEAIRRGIKPSSSSSSTLTPAALSSNNVTNLTARSARKIARPSTATSALTTARPATSRRGSVQSITTVSSLASKGYADLHGAELNDKSGDHRHPSSTTPRGYAELHAPMLASNHVAASSLEPVRVPDPAHHRKKARRVSSSTVTQHVSPTTIARPIASQATDEALRMVDLDSSTMSCASTPRSNAEFMVGKNDVTSFIHPPPDRAMPVSSSSHLISLQQLSRLNLSSEVGVTSPITSPEDQRRQLHTIGSTRVEQQQHVERTSPRYVPTPSSTSFVPFGRSPKSHSSIFQPLVSSPSSTANPFVQPPMSNGTAVPSNDSILTRASSLKSSLSAVVAGLPNLDGLLARARARSGNTIETNTAPKSADPTDNAALASHHPSIRGASSISTLTPIPSTPLSQFSSLHFSVPSSFHSQSAALVSPRTNVNGTLDDLSYDSDLTEDILSD